MATSVEKSEIGRVTWTEPDGTQYVAILRSDATWDIPGLSELAGRVTRFYRDSYRATSPADGFPGIRELHDWAKQTGGTVELSASLLAEIERSQPDTVY